MLIDNKLICDYAMQTSPREAQFNGLLVKSLVSRSLFRNLTAATSPTTRTRIWHSHIAQTDVKVLLQLFRSRVKECL